MSDWNANVHNTVTDSMASTAHTGSSFECHYLHPHTSPIPHVFPSEQAELVHINEQISALDNHISQLNSLRRVLHDRSRQLHNLLSPIYSLPVEVLSRIFQQAAGQEDHEYTQFEKYRTCLHQAFVLSSVSVHFRHVAFCMPELWRRVPLKITVGRAIGQLSSLLQHCMTFAPSLDILVDDRLDEEEGVRSAMETLLTSEVTRRIKTFELNSSYGVNVWKIKLKGSSFPVLDNLCILGRDLNLDLQTLNTVTRLEIRTFTPDCLITMPPSVRYLFLDDVRPKAFVSMLYHCPNLEECLAYDAQHYSQNPVAQFDRPLTLTHLKRLTLGFIEVAMTPSSVQNLRLPSLEYLRHEIGDASDFVGLSLLCGNVSETLTTLKIYVFGGIVAYDNLYQLCGLPFPNLRKLGFGFRFGKSMPNTIRALTRQAEERSKGQLQYLPSLAALTLDYNGGKIYPRCLLDLLEKWRVGEKSYFHLKIKGSRPTSLGPGGGSPEVEEELRSIVGNRQIEVTWDGRKV